MRTLVAFQEPVVENRNLARQEVAPYCKSVCLNPFRELIENNSEEMASARFCHMIELLLADRLLETIALNLSKH